MRHASPLPEPLLHKVFTAREALAAGVTKWRLRGPDIVRVGHGLYRHADAQPSLLEYARPLCSTGDGSWLSHMSSAQVHGLWLPRQYEGDTDIHISCQPPAEPPRRRGVVGHRARVLQGEVTHVQGVPVASPARCWIELSRYLGEDELICLGDHLVRRPRKAYEGRTEPHTTLPELLRLHHAHRRRPGSLAASRAIEQVRVGADSVPETRLRLALIRAGLPEPQLQLALDPTDPYSQTTDLGYRSRRLAIQYDGVCHLDRIQQSRDIRRNAAFALAGWTVLCANADDLQDGFQRIVRDLRYFFLD